MSVECARCDKSGAGTPESLPEGWALVTSTMSSTDFIVCDTCQNKQAQRPVASGNVAADQLRLLIERVQRLNEEKRSINSDIADVYAEAKATGFDTRIMKQIVKALDMPRADRLEMEAIYDTYMHALGMDCEDAQPEPRSTSQRSLAADQPSGEPDYQTAVDLVVNNRKASASWLQRQMRIGYNSASRLIEKMEAAGVVSAPDPVGRREVITPENSEIER